MSTLRSPDGWMETRKADNFINASKLCKDNGKKISLWIRLKSTKALIELLEIELDKKVIDYKVSSKYGVWIHPRLAISLSQWISPSFAIKVSEWMEEWKSSEGNEDKFDIAVSELSKHKNDKLIGEEKRIQLKLKQQLGAKIEVKTPVGNIDLLTSEHIIEVKKFNQWKHALGQILCYSNYYPNHKKQIYLYENESEKDLEIMKSICKGFGVEVIYYSDKE